MEYLGGAPNPLCLFRLEDTAGQEAYKGVRSLAYQDTDILFMAFSVMCRASYVNITNTWSQEYQDFRQKYFKKTKVDSRQ